MVDFSNAKIISLAVHKVGNKSKDEELILTDVISTIADNIAEQYIKEYFFSSFNFLESLTPSSSRKGMFSFATYAAVTTIGPK